MNYEHERSYFPLLLNEWGLLNVGVEVGVCQGLHAANILSLWPGQLHLVDPWAKLDDYEEEYDHEANYAETIARLSEFGSRYTIHRTTSLVGSARFQDGELDFVYLDANHSYDAVRDDIAAWWPKVRVGGILAGDDYGIAEEQYVDFGHGRIKFGVRKAVDEFAHQIRRNISIDIYADWSNSIPGQGTIRARGWWLLK